MRDVRDDRVRDDRVRDGLVRNGRVRNGWVRNGWLRNGWRRDLLARGAGAFLLLCCGLLTAALLRSAALRHHAPTPIDLAAAAAGFLCLSAGAALTVLGAHIFDTVTLSERWTRRPPPPPAPAPGAIARAASLRQSAASGDRAARSAGVV